MHKSTLTILSSTVLLAACQPPSQMTLEQRLQNPLFAERYADEIVDSMVELKIREDPIIDDEAKFAIIEKNRKGWLKRASEATKKQREGTMGLFNRMAEYVDGEVLYLNDILYFSSTFESVPGPEVHVYLSKTVDPRDVEFPTEETIDLGPLQTPYGDQQYAVPEVENPLEYLSVVLWDTKLERLNGFAQLSK